MIVSDLENICRQAVMSPGIEKAADFLRRPGIAALPDGRYEIDGEMVFAIVQRYRTAAAAAPRFEAHRKYIDLQFIAVGAEVIGWAPVGLMAVTEPYDAAKDICFGAAPAGESAAVRIGAGQLALLYPEDAHAPRLAAGEPCQVTKIVVKISV